MRDQSVLEASVEQPDSRHSWIVAMVGAIAMIFTFGTPLSYGIFRAPFSETFGIPPISLSFVFSVMLFTFFIGSGLIGVFGTRFRARVLLLTCSLATGIVAPSLYVIDSIIGITIVFATLGLALGTVFVLLASIIPRWFDSHRGTATGLIFVGNGLGLFILPPIWQFAFTEVGVHQAFFIILSVTSIAFLSAGLFCRRPRWAEQSTATTDEIFDWLTQLSNTQTFKLLFVGMALSFAWYQLLAAYAVDLFAYRGLSAAGASAVFGLIGGVSIISRIGGGYLADVIGARRAFLASLICTTLGILLLFVPLVSILLIAIFLIGLGLGGSATLIPLLMEVYSVEKDTAIVGIFNVAGGIAALAMPPLGTASVALSDGFSIAILLTLITVLVAIWTVAVGTG